MTSCGSGTPKGIDRIESAKSRHVPESARVGPIRFTSSPMKGKGNFDNQTARRKTPAARAVAATAAIDERESGRGPGATRASQERVQRKKAPATSPPAETAALARESQSRNRGIAQEGSGSQKSAGRIQRTRSTATKNETRQPTTSAAAFPGRPGGVTSGRTERD